jgi:hypothetical protein
MAIVFVPLNGIGLGHVSRSFALARALRELGDAPVIFSQGIYPEFMAAQVPGLSVGALYQIPPADRARKLGEIAECARQSSPSVVIEDTHPADIRFEPDIFTVLIVRPTLMSSMRDLRERETGAYRAFVIADHPESPTWPFDDESTAEILSWPDWKIMGPVFRCPTAEGRERVRAKYVMRRGQPLYVFSMGGGGSQPGTHDAVNFVESSAELASKIAARVSGARFIYIRGPLFPDDFKVPSIFETYSVESDLPALLAEADGVIGRPSMNSCWEAIGAATPFFAILGKSYVEPIAERLNRLQAAGLMARDLDQWLDASWRASFRDRAANVAARFPLHQAARILRSCWSQTLVSQARASEPSK